MAIRRAKKKAAKTTKRKTAVKKSTPKRKAAAKTSKTNVARPEGQWEAYRNLERQVNEAWEEFQVSIKKKKSQETVLKAKNHLMLLLGECNFMAQQCMRLASRNKSR